MPRTFDDLIAEIDERERRKALEQQTTPYKYQMEGKTGPTFTLEDVKKKDIPYTVDQSDYEKYAAAVSGYAQDILKKSADVLPSTAQSLYDQMSTQGRTLKRTGVGSMMYAGGNNLFQDPIRAAMEAQTSAEEEALAAINNAGRYKTDTGYLLDQKTKDYETYKSVLEQAMGKPEELKQAIYWGAEKEDKGNKALIQQREALKAEIDALEYDPSQGWRSNTKTYTDEEMDALFAAYEDMREKTGNTQTNYLDMYKQETAQEAQGWNDVVLGRYQGDDKEKQDAAARIAGMEQERDIAEWESLSGVDAATGEPLTLDQITERQQRALELRNQIGAVEAQAKEERKTADEKLASMREAQYGKGSIGRLGAALGVDVLSRVNKGIVDFIGMVAKPIEVFDRMLANMATGNMESIGKVIQQVEHGNGVWASIERLYDNQAKEAAAEGYNARKALTDSEALDVAYEVIANTAEQVPDILLNLATYGAGSGMTQAQDAAVKLINSQDMGQLQKLLNSMVGNTSFWTSYIREWGSDKDELAEAGTPDWIASTLATFTALQNAMIEIGGVQEIGLPGAEASKGYVRDVLETAMEEGKEEIVQGITQGALQSVGRSAAGKATPFVSTTPGETAVVNVPDLLKEGALGALAGGLMGGTVEPVIGAVQGRTGESKANKEIGAAVKPETRKKLWALAKEVGGEAQRISEQYNKYKANDKQVGELARAVLKEISGKNAGVTQRAMGNIGGWQDIGISIAAQDVLRAAYQGEELGVKSAETLAKDPQALDALRIALGDAYEPLRKQYMEQYAKPEETETEPEEPAAEADLPDDVDQVLEAGMEPITEQPEEIAAEETGEEKEEAEETGEEEEQVPGFGLTQAYQMGKSGRRQEDFEETVAGMGVEMTPEIQAKFDQGRADYAYAETKRMQQIAKWNGTGAAGVVRSIQPDEAMKAGVGMVSDEYIQAESDVITALRGLAEMTGVNMVLFESPTKEGTHVGDNGWYDPKTRTVYLDIYSGKDNEKAILRTASHELTHFIKDWSPANFRKYRDFLLDYYYGSDKDTVKKLIQEQKEKDGTLDDAEAMEEVIADASEMMLNGEENEEKGQSAVQALSEQHPRLFVRIKSWIDKWAQALTKAWRSVLPSNMASRMLKESSQTFRDAQRMWWEALEDAGVSHRGEIREAEIENEQQAQIEEVRQEQQQKENEAEKAREAALERAGEAQTVEEAQQAIQEAQAAEAAREAAAAVAKQEEQRIAREAEEKKQQSAQVTHRALKIENALKKMSDDAAHYVRGWAEEDGIPLDGSTETGTGFIKEAVHYYNQGKAGIPYTPNTPMGTGEKPYDERDAEFTRRMNQYGQAEKNRAALEEMAQAEPDEGFAEGNVPTAEQSREQVAEEVVRNGFDDDRLFNRDALDSLTGAQMDAIDRMFGEGYEKEPTISSDLFSRESLAELAEENQKDKEGIFGRDQEQPAYEPEDEEAEAKKRNQIFRRVSKILDGMDADTSEYFWSTNDIYWDMEDTLIKRAYFAAQYYNAGKQGIKPDDYYLVKTEQRAKAGGDDRLKKLYLERGNQAVQAETKTQPTPQETQAMETHAQTVQKIDDVLQGMSKKGRALVMKWAANEYVNLKMEDGNAKALAFAQWAEKWYDAGKDLMSVTLVPQDENDAEFPPFMQDIFYKQGMEDFKAEEKKRQKKEAKGNEKPADKGPETGTDNRGDQAGRLLEGIPAEDVQANGGERGTVPGAQEQGRANVGNDAEPDGSGPVRERGQGVSERDHVRHAAGEVTETQPEAEPETPEEEQARETEEAVQETVEETKTYLEAETPKGTNFVIGDSLGLAKNTSAKARYQANVEAIRLLKKIEAENRYATKEEQEILSKYVGWGGLKNAFSETDPKWRKEYAELAELLTPEEYRAANESVLNAHYTSIEVIRAMYEGLRHFGFKGGRMLEPSGGIGHFIGAMPADMQKSVISWTMVELDSITGRIAKMLYPLADIRIQGFQDAEIGNGIMDVAIGNVPFGEHEIYDKDYPKLKERIHNYFFVKAIDKVRPGGLLMFITSHGTMDAKDTAVRSIMREKADLLGAIRLPNTTFKENANTEVVTDILIFRKREDGTPYKGEKFDELRFIWTADSKRVLVNEYFMNHPDMILGKTTMRGTQYHGKGEEMTVEALPGDLGKQIVDAMNKIEGRMDYRQQLSVEQVQRAAAKARKQTKRNGYEVREGKLFQRTEQGIAPVEMKKNDEDRIIGALTIRDAARELQELQKQGRTENEKKEQRAELNRLYDDFEKKFGKLHSRTNKKLILEDPDGYFILSLENFDKESGKTSKADIFFKDTIAPVMTATHAETPMDAAAIVINEKGFLDTARAAELLGTTKDEAEKAMLESGVAYLDDKGTLEPAATYLSGDVRAKLRTARQLSTLDKRYKKNVEALEKIIPPDVKREDIKLRPGQTWIPNALYEQFICEILEVYNTSNQKHVKVDYDPFSGKYTIDADGWAWSSYNNREQWGTKDYSFLAIMSNIMNSKEGKVKYKDPETGKTLTDSDATEAVGKQADKIIAKFQEWMWQDETRAKQMETMYNDLYNSLVTPKYNGDSLVIAGANAGKLLRPYQRNFVQRVIQGGGNMLCAYCVGAGKTGTMAGTAMKLRQLGIVNKPVFVVPKSLVGQWSEEFLDYFPAAKILALGQNDFNPKNRKEFANRITTGDYDAVIMSYQQFEYIQMTPENQREFYQNQIDQIKQAIKESREASGKKPLSVREMESTQKKLEAKLAKLEDAKKDEAGVYFEDMGIDSLFVDEAHYYKKLFFRSSMGRIKGVGDGSGNKTTYDMYQKIKWLQKMNGGRGIVFATATPVMNSMSETYNMQRYLQEDKLEQIGIRSFDAWAAMFGEVVTKNELGVTGKYEEKKLFIKFKNMPELQKLIQSFMDVLTVEDLQENMRAYGKELKIPKMKDGKRIVIHSERSPFQAEYIKKLDERAQAVKKNPMPEKGADNMAVISMDGRKMSYTQHMIDPKLPYEEGCKIIKCVDNVAQIWKESAEKKGTQIVFLDMGVPKAEAETETEGAQEPNEGGTETEETKQSADLYRDIKRMLMAQGVPAEEIAFISDAGDDPNKKQALYKKVREGTVRVLIGSTGKMGVGMNAQDRVVALHHLDAPWRPGDIEQREGRALRQGNTNDEVAVYVYITDDTFDTYMWQTLEWKANVTHNVMNGSNTAREIDGDSVLELSIAEIKAVSQSNPLIKEQFDVGQKIRKLEGLEREHNKERQRARENIAENEISIENLKQLIPKVNEDAKTAAAALDGPFVMKVDGKRYTERPKAAKALLEAQIAILNEFAETRIGKEKKIGEFGGLALFGNSRGEIIIKGQTEYTVQGNFDSDTGNMTRLMNRIKDIPKSADNMRESIKRMEEENKKSEQKAKLPFDGTEELEKLRARKAEIDEALNPKVSDKPIDTEEEEEPEQKIRRSAREALETESGDSVEFDPQHERVDISDKIKYSRRAAPPPKKVVYGYKAFYARDGKLYPPMVANLAEEEQKVSKATSGTMKGLPTPVGIWLDADVGGIMLDENGEPVRTKTTGRLQVKNAKSGGKATLAFRPGWHLGEWPDAKQFNRDNPITGEARALMPDDLVFARVEISADIDYQLDALAYGISEKSSFSRSQAGLPRIPVDGYYKYRTNVDPKTAPWIIAGSIKVVEILDDDDAARICAEYGVTPDPRYSGKKINLADYGLKRGPVTPETEGLERYDKNEANRRNEELLKNALEDPRYKDAYVLRELNFDDPKQYAALKKELARNGQDIEEYRKLYEERGFATEEQKIKYSRRAANTQDREYMEAVETDDEFTQQEIIDEAAKNAGYRYVRYTRRKLNPRNNNADYYMFVEDEKEGLVKDHYGREKYVATDRTAVDIDSLADDLISMWRNFAEEYDYPETAWDISEEYDPEEIVDSAGIFDNQDFMAYLFRHDFFEDHFGENTPVIKTNDGLVVFGDDYNIIKSGAPITYDDQGNVIPPSERFNLESEDLRQSTRDPEDLSNRQLLARAYEGILKDETDRKYLEKYKALIEQLDEWTEEVRKLKREYHDKTFVKGQVDKAGAAAAQEKYRALEKKITEADKMLLQLERSEPLKKVLTFEQKEAKRKAEERATNTIKNYYEGVNRREYAVRIKKTAERLGQWLNHPDNKKHVPKAAQQAVADFLLTITQSRQAEFRGQGGARRERNFIESMRRLKDFVDDVNAYKTSSAEERVEEDYGQFIDMPEGFKEQLTWLIESLEKTIGKVNRVNVVDDMSSEQMKELYKVMMTISTTITTINDFLTDSAFKHVDAAAQNTMRFIRDQGTVEYWTSGRAHQFINWENTQPIRALERFGEGGMAVWNGLRRGQAQLAFNLDEAIRLAEGKWTNEEMNAWGLKGLKGDMFTQEEEKRWRETVVEFQMGGRTVAMTAAQAMSVYNLLKRGQAVGHIFGEGIRVAPFKDGKKMIRDKGGAITQEEAAAIAAYVESDKRMKQVADNMQRIIANYGKKMGNPVNMRRFGYEFMTEDYYWPIETDPLHRQAKTDNSKGNELYRLLNISSVKPLTEGARNRIVVRDAFDVFSQNLIDMAQYNALALPVLDAVKWINYREKWEERTEDGRIRTVYGDGIRDVSFDTYGGQAARYIIELLKDVQGTQATGDWGEDFSRRMLQRYNKAAVAANLSVAAKQPMSITRAGMELGSMDLITGALRNIGQYRHNLETMLKYSGIAVWKINMGFYDVNVSRSAKRLILRDDTKVDKLLNATTALNEKMDTITWAAIWGACETWTRKQGKTYNSTDAFYKAVAEKFEDVIYKTQVVDSILTRSQFMRGTSFMNKWFSSFMSEPTTSYNMVLDAWWKFRNDMRRGLSIGQAFAENRQQILRTTAVYMVSAAVMTLLEALIGALRDDDDYESFAEKFNAGLLNNAMDEFNILNNLPIVRDAMELVKAFLANYVVPDEWNIYANAGGSSPVFSGAETLLNAAGVWDKVLSGNSNYTLYGAIYKTANGLSQITGIPVAPAMREVVTIWNNTVVPFLPEMRIETYESSTAQGAKALYRAIRAGDVNRERTVRGQLAANNVDDKALETALKSLIGDDLKAGKITEQQANTYLTDAAKLGKNEAYNKVKQWEYQMETGTATTSDYAGVWLAIDSGETLKEVRTAIDESLKHGKEKKNIASSLTNKYKETYQYMLKTDKSAAATLKWKLINAFDYLGYEGKKKVEEWEK